MTENDDDDGENCADYDNVDSVAVSVHDGNAGVGDGNVTYTLKLCPYIQESYGWLLMTVAVVHLVTRNLTLLKPQKVLCLAHSGAVAEQFFHYYTAHTQEEHERRFGIHDHVHNILSFRQISANQVAKRKLSGMGSKSKAVAC